MFEGLTTSDLLLAMTAMFSGVSMVVVLALLFKSGKPAKAKPELPGDYWPKMDELVADKVLDQLIAFSEANGPIVSTVPLVPAATTAGNNHNGNHEEEEDVETLQAAYFAKGGKSLEDPKIEKTAIALARAEEVVEASKETTHKVEADDKPRRKRGRKSLVRTAAAKA